MALVSFTQAVINTTFINVDPASTAAPVQTCSFTFKPPTFHGPEFISVLSVRRKLLTAPLLDGRLTFGANNAAPNAGNTISVRHDKFLEINGWARDRSGFALKITYEDTNKTIVNVEKVAVALANVA